MNQLSLSARAYQRVLTPARTIAGLAGSDAVLAAHSAGKDTAYAEKGGGQCAAGPSTNRDTNAQISRRLSVYSCVIRGWLARTTAHLAGSDAIQDAHIAEAIQHGPRSVR